MPKICIPMSKLALIYYCATWVKPFWTYASWWTDLSARAQFENTYSESNWSFLWNSKRLYATKPQNDHTNNPILEIPTQPQMTGFLSIFVLIQSLRLRLFLHLTKIEPLKSYEKCFLFHLNCSFGSCNIQILRGK